MIIAIVIIAILGAAGYLYFLKHRAAVLTEIAVIKADANELKTIMKARIEGRIAALEARRNKV